MDQAPTASDIGPSSPERIVPFRATHARTLAAWSLLAGTLVLAVLLLARALGLPHPEMGVSLAVLTAFYAVLGPLTLVIRRRGDDLSERSDRRFAAAVVSLDLVVGTAILYATGGAASPLLVLAPIIPFALRLLGTIWLTVAYGIALALELGIMLLLERAESPAAAGNVGTYPAVVTMLTLTTLAGVIAATILADTIARLLQRRESEAVAFSEKMNLRAEKLALLLQVGTVLSRHGTFEEVARDALSHIHAHFGAEATVLYLCTPECPDLVTVEALGPGAEREAGETTRARATLGTCEPRLWFSTPSGDDGVRSTMVAPLVVEDTAYGALKVVAPPGVAFNQSKLRLLSTIAAELATTLRTAGVYQTTNAELSRATAELSALTSFTRRVSASFDLEAIARNLLDTAMKVTDSHYGNVTLLPLREGENGVALFANYDPATELRLRSVHWKESAGLYGRALQTGTPVLVNDVRGDPDYIPVVPDVRAKLCVPVMVSSSVLGMVNLESRLVDAYSQGDRDFVAALCESTAIAAKNAHLYREVEDMAVKDGLTGLYNRTYFHQTLQSEVERAQRYGGDLSLVLMDVDDFKLYNDRHGHTAGDDVLRWLGRILTASTRKSDVAARYGGEELAVIMPETAGDQALQAAEKLREVIVTQQPAHWPAPVTVSIGVASHPMDGTTPRALIDSADQRMYAAKRSGKNQVVAGG
ncbi:MAG: hypothetical protein Kow00122_16570 [Thermoleophilia bacterium]